MKRVVLISSLVLICCLGIFMLIRYSFFNKFNLSQPIDYVLKFYNKNDAASSIDEAITKKFEEETSVLRKVEGNNKEDDNDNEKETEYPYSIAPTFDDDGSIIYDGKTLTELTNQLNKSLKGYLKNTGIFFAEYTKDTGLDPYLAVSITLLETGCNWSCSTLTKECNNIGGLKGSGSCNGGSYSKYATLEQGITAYLNIIYNNYYLKGLTTPEQMNPYYAASSQWANKVNTYINSVKNK